MNGKTFDEKWREFDDDDDLIFMLGNAFFIVEYFNFNFLGE